MLGWDAKSLFLVCLGSVGLWLGFPNELVHVPPLVLCYPLALCLLGRESTSLGLAFRRGWCTGIVGASAALYWLAIPVQNVGGLPWWLAVPCAFAIGSYVGLYGAFFCMFAWAMRNGAPLLTSLFLGISWYLLELARGYLLTGFPWLSLAAAFAPWPSLVQGVAVIGMYALGGVFAILACLCSYFCRQRSAIIAACVLIAMVIGFGQWRLHTAPMAEEHNGHVRFTPQGATPVIMVEGNIDQNQKWNPTLQERTITLYQELTTQALLERSTLAQTVHPLVIWPETSMPFYFNAHRKYGPQVRAFVDKADINLLLGTLGAERSAPNSFQVFNRAYLVLPSGLIEGWYDKAHLVPFGEYLPPWLAFDFLRPLLQGVGNFTPGTSTTPLTYDDHSLGMLICYEGIFPEIARQRVADGANVLVNISNDGWFGKSAAPEQHLQLTILRAIEQDRWLVRSTNTGISAVIDNFGRIVLRGESNKTQFLHSHFWTSTNKSVYYTLAPWLPGAGIGLMLFVLCVHLIVYKKQTRP